MPCIFVFPPLIALKRVLMMSNTCRLYYGMAPLPSILYRAYLLFSPYHCVNSLFCSLTPKLYLLLTLFKVSVSLYSEYTTFTHKDGRNYAENTKLYNATHEDI